MRIKILTVIGTRPEAIKLAPVVKELSQHQECFESIVGITGQHDEMLKQVLDLFHIKLDFDLKVMQKNQSLSDLTASILLKMRSPLSEIKPDIVLVQGAGAMGIAAAITAYLAGAYQIILVGGPGHRLKVAQELGIFDHLINIEEVRNPDERVRLAKELTPGGVGPDLVVECAGVPEAVPEGLEMVRRGGTFVEIGSFVDTGETTINPFKHLCFKDIRLLGQYGGSNEYIGVSLKLLQMGLKRGIPLAKIVTHKFPLEDAQEAMEATDRLEGIKTVLTM